MRLESALFASREGLDAHGKAISVIGDNISNSNTVGFKTSRVEFSDLLPTAGGQSGNPNLPTTGAGVQIQLVRPIHESGIIEETGRDLDLAIDGHGGQIWVDDDHPQGTRFNLTVPILNRTEENA